MQTFMKMTTHGKNLFLADFQGHLEARGWSITELARKTAIDQGQVSKIAAGSFKTFSSSIMKICMELGMEPAEYFGAPKAADDRKAIFDSAISIWDGTHRDAEVVVSLLNEIAKLRKHRPKS